MRFKCLLLMMLGAVLMPCLYCFSAVVPLFDQTGFVPPLVDYYETTTDVITLYLTVSGTGEEIPAGQCTYSWIVSEVDQNGTNVTGFGAYDAWIENNTSQRCSLKAEIWEDGWWEVWVTVTVTYPDGYAVNYIQEFRTNEQGQMLAVSGPMRLNHG